VLPVATRDAEGYAMGERLTERQEIDEAAEALLEQRRQRGLPLTIENPRIVERLSQLVTEATERRSA
jgi:hypothetical protein